MPDRILSDDEFVEVWNRHNSATAVSQETGISLRRVFQLRKDIEDRRGIVLGTVAGPTNRYRPDPDVAKMIVSSRRDTNRLELQNGTILVGSDAHYSPGHISVAHKALCNLAFDMGSDLVAVILNGDLLDGGSISRHPRIRWRSTPSVKQELDAIIERTTDIESAVAPGVKLMRTYGNHCARFESRLSAMVPQYEGVAGFTMRDHLPRWEDSDRIDINEDTVVLHDWHSGVHSGWNDVLKGGCNTVTGHTHELGCKAHAGFKATHYGIKTGMLADEWQEEFDYRLGKPGMNWQSGFAVLTWRDGILLHPEFCSVREGKAYFRGVCYAD